MKSEYKSRMAIGLVLLVLGITAEILFGGAYSIFTAISIVVGLVLIIGSILRHLQFGEGPDRDERTTKLGAFALAYAWLVTFVFMSLLLWYFRRRGDVE